MPTQDTLTRKSRIRWQCRRGMLELDVLLLRFLDNGFDTLTETEQATFEELLTHTDPDIYAWLLGTALPKNEILKALVTKIQAR